MNIGNVTMGIYSYLYTIKKNSREIWLFKCICIHSWSCNQYSPSHIVSGLGWLLLGIFLYADHTVGIVANNVVFTWNKQWLTFLQPRKCSTTLHLSDKYCVLTFPLWRGCSGQTWQNRTFNILSFHFLILIFFRNMSFQKTDCI